MNLSIASQFGLIRDFELRFSIKYVECENVVIVIGTSDPETCVVENIYEDNIIVSRKEFHKDYYPENAKGEKIFKTHPLHSIKRIEWGEIDPTNFFSKQ